MRADLLQMVADLTRREEPFVLAVVVRRQAPSSAQVGDMVIVTADGAYRGWLGGSCTRPTIEREAQAALADGKPRLVLLTPEPPDLGAERPGLDVLPMTCHSGGSVEIYLEPVVPALKLIVFGTSPAARALVALGSAMGWSVAVVTGGDPEAGHGLFAGAGPDLFPGAGQVVANAANAAELAPATTAGGPPCYVLVATMGEDDEESIRAALALEPAYLGVVASARRFGEMREVLLARGVAAEALDRIRCPAGLNIGARTPEEIALSVAAEIVERRRARQAQPNRAEHAIPQPARAEHAMPEPARAEPPIPTSVGAERQAPRPATMASPPAGAASPEPVPAEAVDPICGMTVKVAGARHTAEHAGITYYFCCGGCRQRFLAAPESYMPVPVPAAPEGAGSR